MCIPPCVQIPSPNWNDRPNGIIIDTCVIHYTDTNTLEESLKILTDPIAKVSSHYLIDETGQIYALVPCAKRAWHAGISLLKNRPNVNDFSIGIELQNPGHEYYRTHGMWKSYPDPQIQALIALLSGLIHRFPLTLDTIVGHCEIAPGRKIDPGPHFPWEYVRNSLIPVFTPLSL